jgi:hypothetical protein
MGEIFWFIFELTIQVLASTPIDLAIYQHDKKKGYVDKILVYILFGGSCGVFIGVFSLIFFPRALLPVAWMRITNLILAPILAGGILGAIAIAFSKKREYVFPKAHFWSAFCFVLSLALIRFLGIEK